MCTPGDKPSHTPTLTVHDRLKTAAPAKQEAARIDVENAEDDLVQKTEVAITLMKTVLENVSHHSNHPMLDVSPNFVMQPEPLKNLNELAKAQVTRYRLSPLIVNADSILNHYSLFSMRRLRKPYLLCKEKLRS